MKSEVLLPLISVLTGVILVISCKKEYSCENCATSNRPPIAKAGTDQIIILPSDTSTLNGGGSIDPDGSITTYLWTNISGHSKPLISAKDSILTEVSNLKAGAYSFELKVIDNGGLFAKDTVSIVVNTAADSCIANRPRINCRLVPIGMLSEARMDMYSATAGNKILFAGGLGAGNNISTRVDIYDFITNTWSTSELSMDRHAMTVISSGNKVFFAGGGYDNFYYGWMKFTRVDIYDAIANTWSTSELSEARGYLTSAVLRDLVFFAGGYYWDNGNYYSDRVDIYNTTNNTWSTASLSEPREGLNAITAGNKIYFAGGENNSGVSARIDIYDGNTNSWSTSSLNEGKMYFSNIANNDKIYWAGGYSSASPLMTSSKVEIRDINTQLSTLNCLSQKKGAFGTVVKGNEIVFFMGGPSEKPLDFDIYNTVTKNWSIGSLKVALNYPSIISVNNKIYIAGGTSDIGGLSNQVSLLEW